MKPLLYLLVSTASALAIMLPVSATAGTTAVREPVAVTELVRTHIGEEIPQSRGGEEIPQARHIGEEIPQARHIGEEIPQAA